jgi:ATP-binding cassette subfamily F protein uup
LLQDFGGTLFLVSHDRAFLENTVTQVIAFEGNGQLTEFGGGYDDWSRFSEQRAAEAIVEKPKAAPPLKPAAPSKPAQTKLSFKETHELAALPEKIETLETEQNAINAELADPDIYRTDPPRVKLLQARLAALETELEQIMLRWEDLESRR